MGAGWLGLPLGQALAAAGYRVKGSTTRPDRLPVIARCGMEPYAIEVKDVVEGPKTDEFFASDLLIINFPPRRRDPDVEGQFLRQLIATTTSALAAGIEYFLFVSSTGVYGRQDKLVTEADEPAPATPSGRALYAAENYLRRLEGIKLTVVRPGGLVGPNRHPGRFLAGRKDLPNGQAPVNMVHCGDAIAAITAIIRQNKWDQTYNLVADLHPTKADFYTHFANQLGVEPPQFKEGGIDHFLIVSNRKIKADLNLKFQFPDPLEFTFAAATAAPVKPG